MLPARVRRGARQSRRGRGGAHALPRVDLGYNNASPAYMPCNQVAYDSFSG